MQKFKLLKELLDYIPNCILCHKPLRIVIEGRLSMVLPSKPRWGSGNEVVSLKLFPKDGILSSKHKNHSVAIELETNNIIDGQDLVNRMTPSQTYVKKNCPTCHFKIQTSYIKGDIKKENCFPVLTMYSEELHYTRKGGKDVFINKYHQADGSKVSIRLDGKYLPPVPLDFDKFIDLAHLNKRIDTIRLFQ
jgi:hypothetical protein